MFVGRRLLILISTALCLGCSPEPPSAKDRYVPAVELARQALQEVLIDWREGLAPGSIKRLAVGVEVVDKQRKKGQTLDEFEILGEAPGEGLRCFAVRVKLSGPAVEEKVRYVVIGIDPLWVFRLEDYEALNQWSCGKLEEEPAQPPAAGAPSPGAEAAPELATPDQHSSHEPGAADVRDATNAADTNETIVYDATAGAAGETDPRQDK